MMQDRKCPSVIGYGTRSRLACTHFQRWQFLLLIGVYVFDDASEAPKWEWSEASLALINRPSFCLADYDHHHHQRHKSMHRSSAQGQALDKYVPSVIYIITRWRLLCPRLYTIMSYHTYPLEGLQGEISCALVNFLLKVSNNCLPQLLACEPAVFRSICLQTCCADHDDTLS